MPAGTWRVHLRQLVGPAGDVILVFHVGRAAESERGLIQLTPPVANMPAGGEPTGVLHRPTDMKRVPICLILAVIPVLASGCWGNDSGGSAGTITHRAAKSIRLSPGHYAFHLGGRVRVGDKITCVTHDGGPAGGGFVSEPGHGVASSTGFSIRVSPTGRVGVVCPANPGNA